MFASRPTSRLPRQLLLAVSLLLVLGSQVIESGHLHKGGLDMPDCVQCQVDTLETLIGSMPAIDKCCAESRRSVWMTYKCQTGSVSGGTSGTATPATSRRFAL